MIDPNYTNSFEWACTDDSPFNNGTWSDERRPLYYPRNRDAECYDFNDQVDTEWGKEENEEIEDGE